MFETKFLDFCKSQYDVDDTVDYGMNFQKLMISMMNTPTQTGATPTELVEKIQEQQFDNINKANVDLWAKSVVDIFALNENINISEISLGHTKKRIPI